MPNIVRFPVAAIGAAGVVVVESCEKTNSAEVTGSQPFKNLKATNTEYQLSMGKKQGSLETDTVAEADKKRDRAIVAIRESVHSKTYWPEPAVAEAATRMEPMVLQYSADIENKPYNEESTYVHTFIAKLAESVWQADIDLMGIRPLVDHLPRAQQYFEDTQRSRAVSEAAKSEIVAASNKRRDLERALRTFLKYAEAMELTSSSPVWHTLNLTIKQQLSEIERGFRSSGNQSQSGLDKG